MQVDPIKPTLKAPGPEPLKLICDERLLIFAFNNLRRYSQDVKQIDQDCDRDNYMSPLEAGAYTCSGFSST